MTQKSIQINDATQRQIDDLVAWGHGPHFSAVVRTAIDRMWNAEQEKRMDTSDLIGLNGGQDATYWEILSEIERGTTKYWPAIVDGEERPYSSFASIDEWHAARVERERMTVRLLVAGNPIAAESALKEQGYRCLATAPNTLEIYIEAE